MPVWVILFSADSTGAESTAVAAKRATKILVNILNFVVLVVLVA